MKYEKKFFLDYENEMKYIQEKSNQGLHMISIKGFNYEFESSDEKYYYFVETQKFSDIFSNEFDYYISEKENEKIQFVFATKKACYFRRLKIYGPFLELNGDDYNKRNQYQHTLYAFMAVMFTNILVIVFSGLMARHDMQLFYYTLLVLNAICFIFFLRVSIILVKAIIRLIE